MIHGRCECGLVAWEADSEVSDFSHCHCSQCRRLHGAAYATFAGVQADKFRYTAGEEHVKIYASSETNERMFCDQCGSNILVKSKPYPEYLYLCMGTVDDYPELPEAYHQYAGSKAPWHEITDQDTQYEGAAPD